MYQSFENLEVWQKACRIATNLYADLKHCRDFGLKDQMTRAAVSIASNIAEGAERSTPKDFIRFLNIAKGSAAELRTQVYIAQRIDVLENETATCHVTELKTLSAKLHALVKSIQDRNQIREDEPEYPIETPPATNGRLNTEN